MRGTLTVSDGVGGFREIPAPSWQFHIVSPGYLTTLGYAMSEGRSFEPGDADQSIVMDEITAHLIWPQDSAVGKLIKLGDARSGVPWRRVRGVIRTDPKRLDALELAGMLKLTDIYKSIGPGDSLQPGFYKRYSFPLYARTTGDPQRVTSALRRALVGTTPMPPKVELEVERLGLTRRIELSRFISHIFTVLGGIALGLACLGVYGTISQSVADRRREIAIRVALGASSRQIIHALLRERNVILLAGIALGLWLTVLTTGWLATFFSGMPEFAIWTHTAVCVGLFLVIVAVAMVPAWRASRAPPMDVLRAE